MSENYYKLNYPKNQLKTIKILNFGVVFGEVCMFETILTPSALWKKFNLPESVGANIVQEQNIDDIIISKLILEGRSLKDGKVSIYAELMRSKQTTIGPAILLVEEFAIDNCSKLAKDLVSKGYTVLMVDLAGFTQGKADYTLYPLSVSYANYETAKENLYSIKKDAKSTCWYEWCAVMKYAIKYLKDLPFVTKVGAFGVSKIATALWQVIGSDFSLDATVIALNYGWIGYKGIYKFGGKPEPQFDDKMYQFIAGIDSQSYALHIKTPTLLLCATNDNDFEVDRAQDTMSKIPETTYRAMHISENNTDRINNAGYINALMFFDKYLCDTNVDMPKESDIKCDIENGKIIFEVQTDKECPVKIDKVEIFVAEEKINPALRCWQKIDAKKCEEGKYIADYSPYSGAEIIFAYANIEYKNRLKLSTNILSKRFAIDQVENTFKSNILYSSRVKNAHSIFAPATPSIKCTKNIDLVDRGIVREKKGPMGIVGATCSGGLLTFAMANSKYQPKDGSMLMLDVYTKEQTNITIKLISDYFGNKIEYFVKTKILGGDVWHNVMIEMNKFKTKEGMVLKSYAKIEALEISVDEGEYLINNALWI